MQSPDTQIIADLFDGLARCAVAEVRERRAGNPSGIRSQQGVDEAVCLAALHFEDADRERLKASGVVDVVYPASYWERIAAPVVAAVLSEDAPPSPCLDQDNAPAEITTAAVIAALAANGGRLEGDIADVLKALRHAQRQA